MIDYEIQSNYLFIKRYKKLTKKIGVWMIINLINNFIEVISVKG